MKWGSNLQELAVSAVGIGLRPVDLLYFLLEWDFSMVRLVLWQMKSVIPFAGVQVLCGGASGVASEIWVQSAGVGPTFCITGCTANISGVLSDFSGTTTFFKDFASAPSGSAITLFLFDV